MSDMTSTIIVGLVILAIAGLAIFKIIRDRKQGKNSCGCNCSGCSQKCSSRTEDERKEE